MNIRYNSYGSRSTPKQVSAYNPLSFFLYSPFKHSYNTLIIQLPIHIENRIYIRGEFKESLGMNFFSPFQPEREFKVYKSCKSSQIMCSRVH